MFPGGLAVVKDSVLSLLQLEFNLWPGNFHLACQGWDQGKKKKQQRMQLFYSLPSETDQAGVVASTLTLHRVSRVNRLKIFSSDPLHQNFLSRGWEINLYL